LTSSYDDTSKLQDNIREMAIDWLSAGLDPEKNIIFVQSHVKEHAELSLLLGMNTPLSWLERVPTYKDKIVNLGSQGKDMHTYGFLGYPVLMAADIILYHANFVPVGEDQAAHLELTGKWYDVSILCIIAIFSRNRSLFIPRPRCCRVLMAAR
jgi:tryptophanyl-tRNA synthetase